jgi:hypothetical protein
MAEEQAGLRKKPSVTLIPLELSGKVSNDYAEADGCGMRETAGLWRPGRKPSG